MDTMPLDDIGLFVEVAKTGNFKSAAQRLRMPASTLSRRISQLEKVIGVQLLVRTTRKVALTADGQAYFDVCSPLIGAAQMAHETLLYNRDHVSGLLRVSCTPDFATGFLPPVIAQFVTTYPEVSVQLHLTSQLDDLISGELDLAIRMASTPEDNLVARPLGRLQAILCATPTYLQTHPPIAHPTDLLQHACIRMNGSDSDRQWSFNRQEGTALQNDGAQKTRHTALDQNAAEVSQITVDGRLIAGGPLMTMQLVLQGLGVGLVDQTMAKAALACGELTHVLPDWTARSIAVTALTVSRQQPARVRLFVDLLQAHLNT